MNNKIKTESLLVSITYDDTNKINLMVIGKKRKNEAVEIVNAFQGDDAARLYYELISKKG